jgi:hypothetical protein
LSEIGTAFEDNHLAMLLCLRHPGASALLQLLSIPLLRAHYGHSLVKQPERFTISAVSLAAHPHPATVPGLLKFTARLLTVVFVISLRTGAYARVQDQTTCPLPGKPQNEESRFGWLEIVYRPVVCRSPVTRVPGRSGLTS